MLGSSYAIALVEIAEEADELDKVHQDIDTLASMLAEDAAVSCRCLSARSCSLRPARAACDAVEAVPGALPTPEDACCSLQHCEALTLPSCVATAGIENRKSAFTG